MTSHSHNWTTVSAIFIWLSQIRTEEREPDKVTNGNAESFTGFGIYTDKVIFCTLPV